MQLFLSDTCSKAFKKAQSHNQRSLIQGLIREGEAAKSIKALTIILTAHAHG